MVYKDKNIDQYRRVPCISTVSFAVVVKHCLVSLAGLLWRVWRPLINQSIKTRDAQASLGYPDRCQIDKGRFDPLALTKLVKVVPQTAMVAAE